MPIDIAVMAHRQNMNYLPLAVAATLLATISYAGPPGLRVSPDGRALVRDDGRPFFYLADTAWELFHRLTRQQAETYLADRAAKGFNVIQAVVLAEYDGLGTPNAYGHLPLVDMDPNRPNQAYFEFVDWVVDRCEQLDLYLAMLPTWGDKINKEWGIGPEVFNTPGKAYSFGRFLGQRYRNRSIIWVLGGDRIPRRPIHIELWRAMARGLQDGDGGSHLITFHPMGGCSSSQFFHGEQWLAFNMLQSGHSRPDTPNWQMIEADYELKPTKPVIDGEPCYEDHPINWDPKQGWFTDYDVRKAAYRSVFAGACGHTYGCHDIWQFWEPSRKPISAARTRWQEALQLPGASQMPYLRRLIESRPMLGRLPDQSLLASPAGQGPSHVRATRAPDASYAFVYIPDGNSVTVNMNKLSATVISSWWYDPRTGKAQRIGIIANQPGLVQTFSPPTKGPGNDWVLVLDDASRYTSPPGQGG